MTRQGIERHLKNKIPVTVFDVTDSTNKQAREYIKKSNCERVLIVANGQTAGRGRLGRTFYSPKDTGIYMSYAFKTDKELCDTVRVTTASAVAVARAIGERARIKWVNDIYVDGKKVCGILTEAMQHGGALYIIIGVGINVTTALFPDDICAVAGSIGDTDKDRLVADICDDLYDIETADFIEFYREHLLWRGEEIVYIENNEHHPATLVDIDDDGHLIVLEDGNKKTLRSGEISLRSNR